MITFFLWQHGDYLNTEAQIIDLYPEKPSGKSVFLKSWHLWCIIAMVMMQIKFNSLFYKLLMLCSRVRLLVLDMAPGVLAGQPCSEASSPWVFMSCFVSNSQPQVPWISLDLDLLVEYLVS